MTAASNHATNAAASHAAASHAAASHAAATNPAASDTASRVAASDTASHTAASHAAATHAAAGRVGEHVDEHDGDVVRLIRHAKAGSRYDYVGDDRERPLSKKGVIQADAIGERLAATSPPRLLASPYRRCVQTLQPLAERCGLTVVPDARLAEGIGWPVALELLLAQPAGTVACSHGDVIPAVIDALLRRGAELTADPDPRKAVTWELHRVDGEFVRIHVVPPPPQ